MSSGSMVRMKETAPENSLIINVCIVPPPSVGDQCVTLSQSVASPDTLFSLDGKDTFAHMTVYMARFDQSEVSQVVEEAKKVAESAGNLLCEHTGYFMTAGRYLEASYRKTDEFLALQEAFIEKLKAYRKNPTHPYQEDYFAPYTAGQRKNAEETGYDLAYELYRPHITLTRYAEGKVPQVFPALGAAALSFPLGTLCVYEANENGAVFRKLAEFPVKG